MTTAETTVALYLAGDAGDVARPMPDPGFMVVLGGKDG